MATSTFRVLSFCSGLAGLEQGIKLANRAAVAVGYVEREAYAAACLVEAMESGRLRPAPIFDELLDFDGTSWRGLVDAVVAGYPCKPFSQANTRGDEKQRAGKNAWPHVRRIVEEVEPAVVFFENVPRHLTRGFARVLQDLQRLGFRVAADLFAAAEVGAPHRRERLFIMGAHPDRAGRAGEWRSLLLDGERSSLRDYVDGLRLRSPWKENTAPEPGIQRVAHGVANWAHRLFVAGNGVVPACTAHGWKALAETLIEDAQCRYQNTRSSLTA